MDSSDEELALIYLAVNNKIKQNKTSMKRRKWIHEINRDRKENGEFSTLMSQLRKDHIRFYKYFRMTIECFDEVLSIIKNEIQKADTHLRECIGPEERLAIALRYLATGDSFITIGHSFRVGFRIDGKHVTIKCPKKTGSNYWCYLHKFSVVLMAIVGPDYKFLCVDVGGFGRNSDGGIFEASNMGKKFEENLMNVPLPKNLPNQSQPCQCVLIGDEAFGLKPYLMRPFPYKQSKHDLRKEKYNYRLCRARRVVENAFGILAQKFRIFFRPIETKISTTILTIKTACVLHNYLIEKKSDSHLFHNLQSPEPRTLPFIGMSTDSRRASNLAFSTRELFVTYFNNQHEPTAGTVGSERAQNTTEPVFE
ncbi:PREDICTED: uncharacterized protein LOC108371411 isoform X2 [Rhagoletis zephyria]|uniref:uncharacterized protein LOC108371411 isoform X2 n=1 Tax=Rhagoletis zephyria TaxID=28612 RepID=UPI00081147B5|nr:PREDICTED: uncharacterized protein LOC108371411 isoform X2 [Rhagoletis zephyria]